MVGDKGRVEDLQRRRWPLQQLSGLTVEQIQLQESILYMQNGERCTH